MIRILDVNLAVCGTITKYTSIEFERNFADYGTFTIQLPRSAGTSEIQKNKIICHKNSYGIIKYISESDGGVIIKGYDLKYLLAQRVSDTKYGSGKAEYIIKRYVGEITQNSYNKRAFQKLTCAANKNRGASTEYTPDGKAPISDIVSKLCGESLGYDITVSDGGMIFDICIPQTREFVYSKRHGNIKSCEYILDALGEKNYFYNTDSDGNETEVYETAKYGLERCEAASGYSGEASEIKESVLKDAADSVSETIEAEILNPADFGKEWFLGDYITVKCHALGGELTVTKQITSVTEVYEPNTHRVTPTFGKAKESVFRRLVRENR